MEPVGFWSALATLDLRTVVIGVLLLLLASVVTAILTGRLVPRSAVEDIRADRDLWKQVATTSQDTRQVVAELLSKNSDLLDKVIVQGAIGNELLNQLRSGVQK